MVHRWLTLRKNISEVEKQIQNRFHYTFSSINVPRATLRGTSQMFPSIVIALLLHICIYFIGCLS